MLKFKDEKTGEIKMTEHDNGNIEFHIQEDKDSGQKNENQKED